MGCVERKLYNSKYVMCVVTEMADAMKTFKEDNMSKYLDEDEYKFIIKKKYYRYH